MAPFLLSVLSLHRISSSAKELREENTKVQLNKGKGFREKDKYNMHDREKFKEKSAYNGTMEREARYEKNHRNIKRGLY